MENVSYPSPWSDWEPLRSAGHYSRYRVVAPDQYEYDYYESNETPQSSYNLPETQPGGLSEAPDTQRYKSITTQNNCEYSNDKSSSARAPVGDAFALDTRFKVHDYKAFALGMVFEVLWSEPSVDPRNGSNVTLASMNSEENNRPFALIRRFVVIDTVKGCSACLPIMTYGREGTLKHGVVPDSHTIIYTNSKPKSLQGEKLTKSPIKVDAINFHFKLDARSRLNYRKLYTIECNVKVNFVGKVNAKYLKTLIVDFNASFGSDRRRSTESGSTAVLPKVKSPFVQKVHIHSRAYPGTIYPGNVKIDPGNEGPCLVTDKAMDYVRATPTNDTFPVHSLGNPNFKLGGEVELDFSGVDGLTLDDCYYHATFRHTPQIPGGYDMLLNEAFYLETWPEKVPGILLIRPGKAPEETPEEAAERERQSNEEYERQQREWEDDYQNYGNGNQSGQSSDQNGGQSGGNQYSSGNSSGYSNQNRG